MIDPTNYTIEIRKVVVDGESSFEARVRELPDIADYADTADEAYRLALDSIELTASVFEEKGSNFEMPPVAERLDNFSGRVTLRLAKSLHRRISEVANRESISLNQHIVNALMFFEGFNDAHCALPPAKDWVPAPTTAKKPLDMGDRHLKLVKRHVLQGNDPKHFVAAAVET